MLGFTGAYFFDHRRIPEVVTISKESKADLAVSSAMTGMMYDVDGQEGGMARREELSVFVICRLSSVDGWWIGGWSSTAIRGQRLFLLSFWSIPSTADPCVPRRPHVSESAGAPVLSSTAN